MAKGTTKRMWRRILIVFFLIVLLCLGLLIGRLFYLQVNQGSMLQQMATEQQLKDTTINAKRGTIYDCNMRPIAESATVWTVVVEPASLKDESKKILIAQALGEILQIDSDTLIQKINDNSKSYYYIVKRKVEEDIKEKIISFKKENNIGDELRLIEDNKRYYPYGNFASGILGFTGSDSQGLSGVENYYNKYLSGTSGRVVTARNAIGTDMPFDYEQMVSATDGYNLVLTIDEVIQHFLEKSLEEGMKNNDVRNGATAVVMNVKTGAILGMACKEDFDPNDPFTIYNQDTKNAIDALPEDQKEQATNEALQKQWRNKAVSDTYYPGSVFKMVTASMCLQEGIFNETSPFFCSGSITVGGANIGCHLRSGHGAETFVRALCNSCNPAFATMGLTLGNEKFYQYYTGFGYSEKTGIDLPGESSDIFFSADGTMSETDLAVSSFGQNFSITPIQMLTAACTVANGGNLVTPHVLDKVIDKDNNIIKSGSTEIKRQVISEDVSKRMCEILRQNAINGSGSNGYIEGYRIGGKTGTSEKISDFNKTGQMTYIASYCGFAPADDPQVAMLVYYDTPMGSSYYGSMVAAPTFKSVMENILPYLGIERKYSDEEIKKLDIKMPNLINMPIDQAQQQVASLGLSASVYGNGDTVIQQIPEPTQQIPQGGKTILYTDTESVSAINQVQVPDFSGMTLSQVNYAAKSVGINVSISGSANLSGATAISQSIAAGVSIRPGMVVSVNFAKSDSIL